MPAEEIIFKSARKVYQVTLAQLQTSLRLDTPITCVF